MTAPNVVSGMPGRVLSPDEFDQSQPAGPGALQQAKLPPLPPIFKAPPVAAAPRDALRRPEDVAKDWRTDLELTNPFARILTKTIAGVADHPFLTAGVIAAQGIPYVGPAVDYSMLGMMGKDVLEYSAQKAAELSFDERTRQRLELDPTRVSGEDAAVNAIMLAGPHLLRAGAEHLVGLVGKPGAVAEAPAAAIAGEAAAAAEHLPNWDVATMGTKPTPEQTAAFQAKAIETLMNHRPGSTPAGMNTPDEIALRDRPAGEAPPEPGPRMFPATASAITDLAKARDLPIEDAALQMRQAGYEVTPDVVKAAGGDPAKLPPDPARTEQLSQATQSHMEDVRNAWLNIFAPASRSEEAASAANILRANTGEGAAAYEQAAFKLDEFRRAIDPLPDSDKLGFIDAIEGGRSQAAPEFEAAAATIRQTLDDTRDQIRALGTGKLEHFIEDYFPHIWEDPEKAADAFKVFGSRRPFEGGKSFLKERSIPTTMEGVQMGLKPISMNPVDLTLLKLREMQRYLTAHRSLTELKDADLVQLVRAGEKPPEGYARIDDKIATVFGPRAGAVDLPEGAVKAISFEPGTAGIASAEPLRPEDVGVQGTRIMGEYWAPESVARVVNNHLSPGLRGNALYDAYRGLGNSLNQAQLGLSAFHLGFTSMDATVSRAALGIEYLASGKPLEGLGELMSAPAAPITNMMKGAEIRRAYLNPEHATPDLAALANAVKEAGGRVTMDSFYKNSAADKLSAALKDGNYGKAAALSIPAVLEKSTGWIMEHVVPLQKLGIFGDLATKVLADLPADVSLADRRAALASAWDSVDNRMGQVVYDNLFWNRTFKDLAMASVRSVGWNLGTIRELGGGMKDLGGLAKAGLSGDELELSHRAAYVLALPIVVGLYGAAYQMLRTGQGPTEMKDYFYPKTGEADPDGNPERVQVPSYMKDLFAYAGHPWETVKHKMSPAAGMVFEMLQNEDFYGDQIRNVDDPIVKQVQQEASYVAKQVLPFAIRNMMETGARSDASLATKAQSFVGITPAPRGEVRSDAQNAMANYLSQRKTTGATPEDADARQSRAELLSALRDNADGERSPAIAEAVSNAIERHQLTPKDVVGLLKRAGSTPAQERYKRLTLAQALDVFHQSTPREQALFAQGLLKKVDNAIANGRPLPAGLPSPRVANNPPNLPPD